MHSQTVMRTGSPDIHVVETGPTDKPSILFVHGYSQNHLSWRKQLHSPLADAFHLVAIDLRGHGESSKPRDGYGDSEAWASDIRAVVETLSLESFVLVGWSYGSLVALDYLTVDGTTRVDGMNLIGLVAGIGTDQTNEWLQDGYLKLFPDLVSTNVETSVPALEQFIEQSFKAELSIEDRYFLLGVNMAVPPYVRDRMRDRTISHIEFLNKIPVPTLLTHGSHDGVVSIAATHEANRRIPHATLSEYSDTGHTPFWEAPERYNRELTEFVNSVSGSTTNSLKE